MGREFATMPSAADEAELGHELRLAMRGTGASVSAITTRTPDGAWRGATINSMTSVTLNPPALLVSLNSASRIHAAVLEAGRFAVSIFAVQHADMAAAFADPMRHEERFATGAWTEDRAGLPILADAVAGMACSIDATLPYGTHTIVVGKVTSVRRDRAAEPLIYHDGRYGRWTPEAQ